MECTRGCVVYVTAMSTCAPAGATDGDAHLVVAAEAVELVQLVGRVAGPGAHLGQEGVTCIPWV